MYMYMYADVQQQPTKVVAMVTTLLQHVHVCATVCLPGDAACRYADAALLGTHVHHFKASHHIKGTVAFMTPQQASIWLSQPEQNTDPATTCQQMLLHPVHIPRNYWTLQQPVDDYHNTISQGQLAHTHHSKASLP